jgi:hypothetical protein
LKAPRHVQMMRYALDIFNLDLTHPISFKL